MTQSAISLLEKLFSRGDDQRATVPSGGATT